MIKNLLVVILLMAAIGCQKKETKNVTVSPEKRWMDNDIYLAYSNSTFPDRNNEFQKSKLKEALNEITSKTNLGGNYFNFHEVDESVLTPMIQSTVSESEFKSFILIWPDSEFSDFVVNKLGGQVPDPNAVTVLNAAYKRQFFIIIKSSCFVSSYACNGITAATGLRALVARQLGLMTGLTTKDCTSTPGDVMCSSKPSDLQWSPANKDSYFASLNNVLEAILNNPSFYKEYQPPATE